jgi:hypothetical protein
MSDEDNDKFYGLYKKLQEATMESSRETQTIMADVLLEDLDFCGDINMFACVLLSLHSNLSRMWAGLATGFLTFIKKEQPSNVDQAIVSLIEMTKDIGGAHPNRLIQVTEEYFDELLKEEKS